MQILATIMGAALIASASAQVAFVKNSCTKAIYVQSFPYDGSAAKSLTTVPAGSTYSEAFLASGSTLKIASTKTLNTPLFFGYSTSTTPDYAYYELSTEYGNPFASFHNTLDPGEGCMVFDCGPGATDCYSTPTTKKVFGCPNPVNLTTTICA